MLDHGWSEYAEQMMISRPGSTFQRFFTVSIPKTPKPQIFEN
jgi:hypothetical protein